MSITVRYYEADKFHPGYWDVAGYSFDTEEEAQAYCLLLDEYFAAMRPVYDLPDTLSRTEYVAACEALGQSPLDDEQCDSYGVRYGEYEVPQYPTGTCVQMALAKRRLAGIEAERAALPKPTPKAVRYIRCDCGHEVPEGQVMSASLGTSCVDCYDRMSA